MLEKETITVEMMATIAVLKGKLDFEKTLQDVKGKRDGCDDSAQQLDDGLDTANKFLDDLRARNKGEPLSKAEEDIAKKLAKIQGNFDKCKNDLADLSDLEGIGAKDADELTQQDLDAAGKQANKSGNALDRSQGQLDGMNKDLACLLYTSPSPRDQA